MSDDADLIRCLKTVDKFLSGKGSIGGHWFGDKVNGKAFWWRAGVGVELDRAIARIEAMSAQRASQPPMSDEIKALVRYGQTWLGHGHVTHEPKADGYWTPWHIAAERIETLSAALTAQAEEIERLRARLEITDEITERYDGIACRDETIRLLEQKIAALKAAQEVKAWTT